MASKTDIANRALSKLGEARVSNVDSDNNKPAKTIRFMWEIIRDSLLTSYPWNFAVERTQLAADGTAPAWGYARRFTLPSDFLALLEIRYNPDYKIESNYILTDEGAPLYIRYTRRVTDTGSFDPMFVEALAHNLAIEACEELTQSNTKKEILLRQWRDVIGAAFASDAIQDPPQSLRTDEWLLARESARTDEELDYNA